jgi:hypothetical protein
VRVKQPAVEHRERMKDFRRWLESQDKTPQSVHGNGSLIGLAKEEGRGDTPRWGRLGFRGRRGTPAIWKAHWLI